MDRLVYLYYGMFNIKVKFTNYKLCNFENKKKKGWFPNSVDI